MLRKIKRGDLILFGRVEKGLEKFFKGGGI